MKRARPGAAHRNGPLITNLPQQEATRERSSQPPARTARPLTALRGQFPGWEAWRGISGLLYARRRMSSPPVVFRGYTAKSLAEQIREHEARQQ
jgi:hypothetical protein